MNPSTERTVRSLRIASKIVFPTLGGSFLLFAFQAYSQIQEANTALRVADKLQNATLAQGCLIVTALSIGAVCWMARLMYLVMQEQSREKEERLKRAENHNRTLTDLLVKQKSDAPR